MSVIIEEAETKTQRERVYRFRYKVYATELGKEDPSIDHGNQRLRDPEDEAATLFYAEENGRIVGTLRCLFSDDLSLPAHVREHFDIDRLQGALGSATVSVTGRFMIDPGYRGRTVASLLVKKLYQRGLEHHSLVDYCICETDLLALYYRLGYRPYTRTLHHQAGLGLRVPLLLCARDLAHLRRVRSPLARFLDPALDDEGRTAGQGARVYPEFDPDPPLFGGDLRSFWAEFAHGRAPCSAQGSKLFDGLSSEEVQRFLRHSVCLPFRSGESIYLGGEAKPCLGVVLSGRVGVGVPVGEEHHWVEILETGATFGQSEASPGGMSADLVALEDTRTALLPSNVIDRVATTDLQLALRLSRNLLTILTDRVNASYRQTSLWAQRGGAKELPSGHAPCVDWSEPL